MRCAILVVMLGASGCDRFFELSPAPDPLPDAPEDGFVFCLGTGLARTCLRERPETLTETAAGTISTDDDSMCLPGRVGARAVCVLASTDLVVANVSASGSRPLVLLATESLTVQGIVDVASTRGRDAPAAPATCGENAGRSSTEYGGGGAGGSSIYLGGPGSSGGGGMAADTPALPVVVPVELVGGCPGGAGGMVGGAPAAAGGRGGGAIALVAGASIVVGEDARINASGAGGGGGAINAGGGGGGAGGMILFDAPSVTLRGDVFARGAGGGGGGAAMAVGVAGGQPMSAGDQPSGGAGGAPDSANGGAPCGPADGKQGGFPLPPNPLLGGGGGGGSCGYIVVYGTLDPTSVVSNPHALDM